MGMAYKYGSSASYPRFNNEVKQIVELFGGWMITNRKPKEQCTMVEYFMEEPLKYHFLKNTPFVFKKWANDPFGEFTVKETKKIYDFLKTKWRKVKEISPQIADEFKCCVEYNDYWEIT